ncbi:MAG: hypothetical protein PHU25_09715 [Deltaproteobacteria bacterium]|nr:hypothetical protein [Deltaproteobacteria bacterium]
MMPDDAQVTFEPMGDTTSTLTAQDNPTLRFYGDLFSGELVDETAEDPLAPYDPQAFVLTMENGTEYAVSRQEGLRRVADLNGNVPSIFRGGIVHNAGQQVTFERDSQGRVTRVRGPGGAETRYGYDAAGDLVRFTDQAGAVWRYAYESHRLVSVLDPMGREALRTEYDAEGRLVATVDDPSGPETYGRAS